MNELSRVADGVDGGQMKGAIPITTLFPGIGGILLADEWDHHASTRVATNFKCGVDSTCVKPVSLGLRK
jgi:hypothetical protein